MSLAGRAAELSTGLYALRESCGHDQTSKDITNIAGELALLSTTLWRLHEAMETESNAYTSAFDDDLKEITSELALLFDEIEECCTEMQKSDAPNTTAVGWFFKKGRVSRLEKHLEALKTTLVVMRTVLHHGKHYGVMKYVPVPDSSASADNASSPGRLAESAPHTMFEDRAILESIFAKNRHAIMDLHSMDQKRDHKHSSSTSSASHGQETPASPVEPNGSEAYHPGAHGRNLSTATGVEIPPIPDVLPLKPAPSNKPIEESLARRFSKRGVRLGVHMSILDLGAHDTALALRKKWIAQAHSKEKMSEPAAQHMATIEEDAAQVKPRVETFDPSAHTTRDGIKTPPRTSSDESVSKARRRANSLITSPAGKAFSKVIRRLSLTSIRKGTHSAGKQAQDEAEGIGSMVLGETDGNNDARSVGPTGVGIKTRLSMQLTKPELKTPDYNQEFENGRL